MCVYIYILHIYHHQGDFDILGDIFYSKIHELKV
jgi:hypothetical protein